MQGSYCLLPIGWTCLSLFNLKFIEKGKECADRYFCLPDKLDRERLKELDDAFALTRSTNSEIVFAWLLLAVKHGYEPAFDRLEKFLTEQGRRKFLEPLYEELVKTPAGKERALAIYRKARATYHPVSAATVDAIVEWKEGR